MRVAVYGGSFNPPHMGHALVAAWVAWSGRADEVWLLPAFHHAFDKPLAPWGVRLAMVEALAATLGAWARAEPIEASLPVPSYTLSTLDALAARHPEHTFHLVVGADILSQLPQWRDVDALRERYPLLVVGRQGCEPVEGAPSFPDISSTEVRRRMASGERVDHLVPAAVLGVARAHGLYTRA